MKTCPYCGELLGDSVSLCFKCRYSFKSGRVLTKEDLIQLKQDEEKQKQEEEKQKHDREEHKQLQIVKNPLYEYKVIVINNLADGQINQDQMQITLDEWSEKGWRLHSVFNNELGKTSSAMSIGILGTSVNATIDQTVVIFERCIKAEFK